MAFQLIDIETWERREFYEHFIKEVVCSFSVTVNLDITLLKEERLYPAMIWLLTKTVNEMPEFRMSLTKEGLGVYDSMHPMYTVFNKENKNFSGIWSYFSDDYSTFLRNYEADVSEYSHSTRYTPKAGTPENAFNISMVPWLEFTSLNLNVYDEGPSLPWANTLNATESACSRWPFRFIMPSATVITWDCLLRNCRVRLKSSEHKHCHLHASVLNYPQMRFFFSTYILRRNRI